MGDLSRIFNLEKSFNTRNKLILTYYNENINGIEDVNKVNILKDDLKNYEDLLDDINSRMSQLDSYCDRISLLVERDKYLEHLILSCGITEPSN